MSAKLAILMDEIDSIHAYKDTSLALLIEGQRRGYDLYYFTQEDLFVDQQAVFAYCRRMCVYDDAKRWYRFTTEAEKMPLTEFSIILMRKDPPFDAEYIYTTYLLELAEQQGVKVINKPQGLRDANEKAFAACFPQCMPAFMIARKLTILREFVKAHGEVVLKPLDSMGGREVFKSAAQDPNLNALLETLTHDGQRSILLQQYIPEISEEGDKRIMLINGDPVPYAYARFAKGTEFRANLATGGVGKGVALSKHDYWICEQVGPVLKEKGLMLVGIDVIGKYLTEINVTSPTCIRELDDLYDLNISGQLFDEIEALP